MYCPLAPEFDGGIQTAGNGWPVGVGGLLVVDVDHVDLVELAPFNTLTVQLGNTIGREVGDLDAQLVLTFAQGLAAVEDERHGPSTTHELTVDIHTG